MTDYEKFAIDNGFDLKLGGWNFIYIEKQRKLTLPVEMLAQEDFLWELSRSKIKTWDHPHELENITEVMIEKIMERVSKYIELTGKKIRII